MVKVALPVVEVPQLVADLLIRAARLARAARSVPVALHPPVPRPVLWHFLALVLVVEVMLLFLLQRVLLHTKRSAACPAARRRRRQIAYSWQEPTAEPLEAMRELAQPPRPRQAAPWPRHREA